MNRSTPLSLCDTYRWSTEWMYIYISCAHAHTRYTFVQHTWLYVEQMYLCTYARMYSCFNISSCEAQAKNWKLKSKALQFTSRQKLWLSFQQWVTNINTVINQNLPLFLWYPGFVSVLLWCINFKGDPADELLCWNLNVPREATNTNLELSVPVILPRYTEYLWHYVNTLNTCDCAQSHSDIFLKKMSNYLVL